MQSSLLGRMCSRAVHRLRLDGVGPFLLAAAFAPLTLALPAAAQDWPELESDYQRHLVSLLGRLRSTQAQNAFILRRDLDLEITDNPSHVDDHTQAAYDLVERKVFVDLVRLEEAAEELVDLSAPRETVAEILAWKTLPTVVHEISHAMTQHGAEKAVGRPHALPVLESEMISYFDGALTLHELFALRPELWRRERILQIERIDGQVLQALQGGPAKLREQVALVYEGVPSVIETPRTGLLAEVEARIKDLEEAIADMGRLRDKGAALAKFGRHAAVGRRMEELQDMLRYARRNLELRRSTRVTLADPAAFAKLQAYYRKELKKRLDLIRKLPAPEKDP